MDRRIIDLRRARSAPMEDSGLNETYKEIPQVFVRQYNLTRGTHYEFECVRKSMFSLPKYQFQDLEICQLAFMEGKRRNPIVADLTVLLRLQKRLIIEVVEPRLAKEGAKVSVERCIEKIVDPIERDALSEAVCSKYLSIDGRSFGHIRISAPEEIYKKGRLQRDEMFKKHEREFSQVGLSSKHWFREIWLSYRDQEDVLRCLQIW